MIEKNINSRIIHKHDLEANWIKATNFIPKQGEIIIYDCEIDDNGNTLTLPANRTTPYTYPRFKIGDGIKNVNDLSFSVSQFDWNQNDSTAPDYIKNRTHWAEAPVTTTTMIIPETALEGFTEGYLELVLDVPLFDFKLDTEYTVTWDSVEYTVITEKVNVYGVEAIICGNPAILMMEENPEDNGQPFAFLYAENEMMMLFLSNDLETTSHTVGITQTVTTQKIHKLDDKYINAEWLPQKTMVPTVGVVETTMTVRSTGENMLPSESYDMNALMSAEYYDVLWNGEVYRYIPTIFNGILLIGNRAIMGVGIDSGEPFLFGCSDSLGSVRLLVLSDTEATFSITCYNSAVVSTIPEEYLPEKLQFGNEYEAEIHKEAITWDGDTTGRATLEALNLSMMYHVSNVIPTFEDLCNGGVITALDLRTGLPVSEEFTSNDIVDQSDGQRFLLFVRQQLIIVANLAAQVLSIPAGIYFLAVKNGYISSFTINNYTFVEKETKIKTIDPKYLPEGFGSGSGLPEVSAEDEGKTVKVVAGEWSVEQMSYNDLSDKPTLFSGNYNDLSNKPTLGALASKNSLSASEVGATTIDDVNSAIEAAIGAAIAASY